MLIPFARSASARYICGGNDMSEVAKYLKGQLLLDSGQLGGSFFQRTVILVCQHDVEGAFGLVLNRSTGNKLGEMVVADLPEQLKDQTLYLGGPVQLSALSFLHSDDFLPGDVVMPNLELGHSLMRSSTLASPFPQPRKSALSPVTRGGVPASSRTRSNATPGSPTRLRSTSSSALPTNSGKASCARKGLSVQTHRRYAGGRLAELISSGHPRFAPAPRGFSVTDFFLRSGRAPAFARRAF